jgi:lysophospholipase L1-like esterase
MPRARSRLRRSRRFSKLAWLKPLIVLGTLAVPLIVIETCARSKLEAEYGESYPLFGGFGGGRAANEGFPYHTLDPVMGWNISSQDDIWYFPQERSSQENYPTSCGFVILRQREDFYSKAASLAGGVDLARGPCGAIRSLQILSDAANAASARSEDPAAGRSPGERPLLIIALGGSTTDQTYIHTNWPLFLLELLEERGRPAVILNGAVGSYGTKSELLKLVRDVRALAPDIVISYSGVNELLERRGEENARFRENLMRALVRDQTTLMPNLSALLRGSRGSGPLSDNALRYTMGVPERRSSAEAWLNNLKTMKAVCEANGIQFYAFLQPAVGSGGRPPSEQELATLAATGAHHWLPKYQSFYRQARTLLERSSHGFIYDLSQAFDEMPAGNFMDDCHLTEEANRYIARQIAETLFSADAL